MNKFLVFWVFTASLFGQQSIDNSTALSVIPIPIKDNFPGACKVGEQMYFSTGTPGANRYECGNTNNWILVAPGGSIPSTTAALKGNGSGGASAVTGTGTNCVLVNGSSATCGSGGGATIPSTTNVLIGSGTGNGADSGHANPVGAFLGTTDIQTTTNKTVDGVTPVVFAFLPNITSDVQAQLNSKGSVAGTNGAVQANVTGAFGGDSSKFAFIPTALSIPGAPTVLPVGTTGATTYGYTVSALSIIGQTPGSSETQIANGNGTLDGTNFNTVTTAAVTGSTSCVVFRTTGGSYGAIANIACGASYNDIGTNLPANAYGNYPGYTTNGSAGVAIVNSVQLGNDALIGSYLNHDALFDASYQVTDQNNLEDNGTIVHIGVREDSPIAAAGGGFGQSLSVTYSGGGTVALGKRLGASLSVYENTDAAVTNNDITGANATASGNGNNVHYRKIVGVHGGGSFESSGSTATVDLLIGVVGNLEWYDGTIADAHAFEADINNSGGVVTGKNVAYFNAPWGEGGFSWYNSGGIVHSETGAASNIGMEIEAFTTQSADLFRTLASDGTTVQPFRILPGGNAAINPVATSALPGCSASTGPATRAAVNDATTPTLGVTLTGGGAVFANVHCSLTTGTYIVDGL